MPNDWSTFTTHPYSIFPRCFIRVRFWTHGHPRPVRSAISGCTTPFNHPNASSRLRSMAAKSVHLPSPHLWMASFMLSMSIQNFLGWHWETITEKNRMLITELRHSYRPTQSLQKCRCILPIRRLWATHRWDTTTQWWQHHGMYLDEKNTVLIELFTLKISCKNSRRFFHKNP